MQFLGTAAADGLPNPFCNCPLCRDARISQERGRMRSMFLLDQENLIDCGPDLSAAAMRHGVDLTNVHNIFLTHTHEDHFCESNAGLLRMARTRPDFPVNLYLSEMAYDSLMQKADRLTPDYMNKEVQTVLTRGLLQLIPVNPGKMFSAGGYEVMPLNTTHKASATETAINYRFRKDGHSLLYACDTGLYIEESLELLRNSKLDILIMEGTWGNLTNKPTESHLNAYAFVEQLNIFRRFDIIRDDTRIYCTHINHRHDLNHEAYQHFFDVHTDFNVTVAYDGLKLDWED